MEIITVVPSRCRTPPAGSAGSCRSGSSGPQFCADPCKVDHLRPCAVRVAAAFPATLPGYAALGYQDAAPLLATPITTAAHVATWTDSIFTASLPLPSATHTGALPAGAGYHHYPKPIVDIDHFRFDDSQLFVTDAEVVPTVVVPVARRGSDDGRVRLIAAHPDSRYIRKLIEVDVVRHAGDVDGIVASAGTRRTRPALLTADDADVAPTPIRWPRRPPLGSRRSTAGAGRPDGTIRRSGRSGPRADQESIP